MAQRTATIGSRIGLHARPAAVFTRAVEDTGLQVWISKGASGPQDAASILGVMTLGAEFGDTVTLQASGTRAAEVLDELADLLGRELDA